MSVRRESQHVGAVGGPLPMSSSLCVRFCVRADVPAGLPCRRNSSINTWGSHKKLMDAVDVLIFLKLFNLWV